MKMRITLALATAAAVTAWTVPASAQRPEIVTWTVDGVVRQAIVYAPSAPAGGPAPLVLSFHGHGDDMHNFQYTNLHQAWPEAIVVYFQGLPSPRDRLAGW